MTKIAILGSGIAGLGANHRLSSERADLVVFEKNAYFGGKTASFLHEGLYTFDAGPHVSFTKNERVQEFLADAVDDEYETVQYRVNNHWKGMWFPHPVQCNLHGLPRDLVVRCIEDFVEASRSAEQEFANYEEWLLASLGRALAETFPMVYTEKYHTTAARNMSTDWIGPRVYRPALNEVLTGALSPTPPNVHYVTNFRYPSHGGFVSYLRKMAAAADIRLSHEVVQIDPRERSIAFANGKNIEFDGVVSSLALPDLIERIPSAPADVREAAAKLACTTCVLVNLVIDRPEMSDAHISYFYDSEVFFTRLSSPYLLSPNNVPPGTSSVQAECYFSAKYRPLDRSPESCIAPVIDGLRKVGLLGESDQILFQQATCLDYANVIYDLDRSEALAIVHGYLDDVGIAYCGRYGDWGYMWTDESFVSGERAAEKVIGRL